MKKPKKLICKNCKKPMRWNIPHICRVTESKQIINKDLKFNNSFTLKAKGSWKSKNPSNKLEVTEIKHNHSTKQIVTRMSNGKPISLGLDTKQELNKEINKDYGK